MKVRKHLSADGLFKMIKDHRPGNIEIPLEEALMSGFALFSLKDQLFPRLLRWGTNHGNGVVAFAAGANFYFKVKIVHGSTVVCPFRWLNY